MKTTFFRLIVTIAASIFISGVSWAQTATVAYAQGVVESQKDGIWTPLKLGAQINDSDIIRIRDGGLAELKASGGVIHVSKDGIYKMADLLATGSTKRNDQVLALVSGKIGKMSSNTSGVTATVGGVRAALAGSDGPTWASEDPDETVGLVADPMADVRKLIDAGKLDAALVKVDGLINGKADNLALLHLTKARILGMQGLSGAALRELDVSQIKKGEVYFTETQLLSASLNLDLQSWDDAIQISTSNVALKPESSVAQSFLIIQAIAQKAKGDTAAAKTSLTSAVAVSAQTPEGQEAARLLTAL